MARFTPSLGIQVPEGPDANNVPQDAGYIADYLDANPGVSRLTSTQIAALTAPQKPAGRVVYNTTTGQLQVSDGSAFNNVSVAGLSLASTTPATILPDAAGSVGVGTTAARSDHTHPIAADTAVGLDAGGVSSEGTSTSFARADHTHELAVAAPPTIVPLASSGVGSATSFARSDHAHALTTAAGSTIQPDDAAAVGTATSLSRSDHKHAIAAAAPAANLTATTTNAEGAATSFARSDHSHAITTGAAGQITAGATAGVGSSTSLARADHVHSVATGAATAAAGAAAAEGTSTSLARADHVHPPTPTAGIVDGAVTTPKVADLAITDGKVATANKDGLAATPSMRTLGTGAQQAAAGNDSRLSDARTPTGAAGGDLTGTYPNPTIAAGAVSDVEVAAANKDGAAATPSMRTLGTGAQQACAGNDSRLSNARTPTGTAGGVLSGTYPNPGFAAGQTHVDPILTRPRLAAPTEDVATSGSAPPATTDFDARAAGVGLWTANATANFTLNVRGDASNTLSSLLAVGESITVLALITNGATAYRPTAFQIDGVAVTPKWSGGSAPSAGSPNAIDGYQLTIIKTAATPTYTVLATAGKYA